MSKNETPKPSDQAESNNPETTTPPAETTPPSSLKTLADTKSPESPESPANSEGSNQGSSDSEEEKSGSKIKTAVFISAQYSHKGVTFSIGKTRAPTSVTGEKKSSTSQGDHVTPYSAFLEFLYNVTSDQPINEIPAQLTKVVTALFPDSKQEQNSKKIAILVFQENKEKR